jgi:teichuronic acid biosynthesis glycosyltransferase TuaH
MPGRKRLYFLTDDFVAGAGLMGLSPAEVRLLNTQNIAAADVVLVISPELSQQVAGQARHLVVLPNGCDVDVFAEVGSLPLPDDVALAGPIAGVVGQLNERLDLGYLAEIADRGVSLLLVGPRRDREAAFGAELDALLLRPNVQWIGQRPAAEIPAYLSAIDVGLTPYADSQFNRASFPLKTLEYLAAGRAVVSTDLPAVRWLATDLIEVGRTPADFADRVQRLLAEPHTAPARERRRAFARVHSWESRAETLAALL